MRSRCAVTARRLLRGTPGSYDGEVVAVPGSTSIATRASVPTRSIEALAALRPAFRARRDGDRRQRIAAQRRRGSACCSRTPRARDAPAASRWPASSSRGVSAVEPPMYGIGPVDAANAALQQAGIGWNDLAVVELNEAFAAQSLACLRDWPELDPEKVNPNGGAIAIGHPIGCSGARIIGSLAHELRRRGGGYGLAAICIGVGQGLAVVLEG